MNVDLAPEEDTPPFEVDTDGVDVENIQPDHSADEEDLELAEVLGDDPVELPDEEEES